MCGHDLDFFISNEGLANNDCANPVYLVPIFIIKSVWPISYKYLTSEQCEQHIAGKVALQFI